MKLMIFLSSTLSFLIMKFDNPMMFVLLILIQSLMLCLILCLKMKTSWFSYILFLIFLGGLMIIFSYVCSLASNESILIKLGPLFTFIMTLLGVSITLNFSEMMYYSANENIQSIMKMLFKFTMVPSILSMFYLLITLIVIVKISFKNMGSLRSAKKYDNSKN